MLVSSSWTANPRYVDRREGGLEVLPWLRRGAGIGGRISASLGTSEVGGLSGGQVSLEVSHVVQQRL